MKHNELHFFKKYFQFLTMTVIKSIPVLRYLHYTYFIIYFIKLIVMCICKLECWVICKNMIVERLWPMFHNIII